VFSIVAGPFSCNMSWFTGTNRWTKQIIWRHISLNKANYGDMAKLSLTAVYARECNLQKKAVAILNEARRPKLSRPEWPSG